MELVIHTRGTQAIVHARGDITFLDTGRFRAALREVLSDGQCDLVVDLDEVSFIDAPGLAVLVGASESARSAGGSLSLICNTPAVMHAFEITGLASAFTFYPTVEVAVDPAAGRASGQ